MSDFVEWNPKRHGQQPPYWEPGMPTSVDGLNFSHQPNWAWIAGSTYYVPREAVELPRIEPEPAQTDELVKRLRDWVPAKGPPEGRTAPDAVADMREAADRIEALTAENERLRKALRVLRDLPIVENDNANTLHLDGATHTGPVVDWLFHFVRKIKEVSDRALEKQP
jgi:hypothetical protein